MIVQYYSSDTVYLVELLGLELGFGMAIDNLLGCAGLSDGSIHDCVSACAIDTIE